MSRAVLSDSLMKQSEHCQMIRSAICIVLSRLLGLSKACGLKCVHHVLSWNYNLKLSMFRNVLSNWIFLEICSFLKFFPNEYILVPQFNSDLSLLNCNKSPFFLPWPWLPIDFEFTMIFVDKIKKYPWKYIVRKISEISAPEAQSNIEQGKETSRSHWAGAFPISKDENTVSSSKKHAENIFSLLEDLGLTTVLGKQRTIINLLTCVACFW